MAFLLDTTILARKAYAVTKAPDKVHLYDSRQEFNNVFATHFAGNRPS